MDALATQYHFSDFTLSHYRELLRLAVAGWDVKLHREVNPAEDDASFILWRHDVDFSMHAARNLARLEHEAGVRSTYYLLPHSEFYNLFEREVSDLVKEIISLGHDVGLHFDSHYYGISDASQLAVHLTREKRWLEETFNCEIRSFSFHNTTDFTMSCEEWQYAGLINCYAQYFKKNVGYCSDSHGIWRFRRLHDVLTGREDARLQVLTHPEWWQEQATAPRQRVQRAIDGRAAKVAKDYDEALARIGRPNIGK